MIGEIKPKKNQSVFLMLSFEERKKLEKEFTNLNRKETLKIQTDRWKSVTINEKIPYLEKIKTGKAVCLDISHNSSIILEQFNKIVLNLINKNDICNRIGYILVILNEVFSNVDLFQKMLLSNNRVLCSTNLALDDEMIHDFVVAMSYNDKIFRTISNSFYKMISCFLNKKIKNAYFHIRGLILILAFEYYYSSKEFSSILIPILNHINNFQLFSANLFFKTLIKLPKITKHIINVCQNTLTLHIMENKIIDPNNNKYVILSHFLTNLRNKTAQYSWSNFSSKFFSNNKFTRLISPIIFYKLELSPFYSYPALLTLSFKEKLLRIANKETKKEASLRAIYEENVENEDLFQTVEAHKKISLHLEIRREYIIEDTINIMSKVPKDKLTRPFMVTFIGEEGFDIGGVSREYFNLLLEKLFSPDYCMFTLINKKYYWFNQNSNKDTNLFNIIGTIISIAIYNSIILPIRFPLLLYKKILHYEIGLNDIIEINPELYNSFRKILTMKEEGEDLSSLYLNFTAIAEINGKKEEINLIEDGKNIIVKNSNVEEYISKYIEWYITLSIEKAFNAFYEGFTSLCNGKYFNMFAADELDILVSGEEIYEWEKLQYNAKYIDGYTSSSKAIVWFWELFNSFSEEMKLNFLRFTTGTDRAPIGGLANISIKFQRNDNTTSLPTSHTCFSTFCLPDYESKEDMEKKLKLALLETEGFGII